MGTHINHRKDLGCLSWANLFKIALGLWIRPDLARNLKELFSSCFDLGLISSFQLWLTSRFITSNEVVSERCTFGFVRGRVLTLLFSGLVKTVRLPKSIQ